mgnify:FL=1
MLVSRCCFGRGDVSESMLLGRGDVSESMLLWKGQC